MRRNRTGAALVALATLTLAGPSWGQPMRGDAVGVMNANTTMLRQRLGVDKAEAMLLSMSFDERLRGVDRLAAIGTEEAGKALAAGMSPGSATRSDPRTRLAAVRALAVHAKEHEEARRVLVSVLNSVRGGVPEQPLEVMARATAALGLARAGTDDALTALLAAVIGRGRTGELATAALVAFPPADLGPLGRSTKTMSADVIALLGKLGDVRALGILRKQLKRKQARIQRAAAVALAQLGDGTPAAVALKWGAATGKDKKADTQQRLAGAEVLMLLDAPQAAAAIAQLLGDARTRSAALSMAERSLSPALVPTLKAVVDAKVTSGERARAATILALIGDDGASTALLALLARPELATIAAFGLARSHSDVAGSGLARALEGADAGPPRRLMLRAALVRWLERGEQVSGLGDALVAAFSSNDAADRAVAAFGLAVTGARDVADLVQAKEPEVVMAAASAALVLGPSAMGRLGKLLKGAPLEPDARAVAASVALLSGSHGVSTERLLAWAEGGSSLAPLAALRFAARDSKTFRHELIALLEGTDAVVRLHVALGLAHSPEHDAVALLADAYRFEPDVRVRRAIVRALSVRSEQRRVSTLERAAALDPDGEVRGLARAALKGRTFSVATPNGRQVAWVSLRANSDANKSAVASRPGMLIRDDGLALPVVSAPDGVILVPGLGDRHEVSIVIAVDDED